MGSRVLAAAVATAVLAAASAPAAQAAGCIKGAVVGGVAGHYAGHGVLGALGGCVVGRHMAKQSAERQRQQELENQQGPSSYDGRFSPDPAYKRSRTDPQYDNQTYGNYNGTYPGAGGQPGAVQDTRVPAYTSGGYRQ